MYDHFRWWRGVVGVGSCCLLGLFLVGAAPPQPQAKGESRAGGGATRTASPKGEGVPSPSPQRMEKVRVSLPKTFFPQGGEVGVLLDNLTSSPIYLPTCSSFTLERLEGEVWVPISPAPCGVEGVSEVVGPGGQKGSTLTPDEEGRVFLRVAVTYGTGCQAGLPLDQGECRTISTVYSRYFPWYAPGEGD